MSKKHKSEAAPPADDDDGADSPFEGFPDEKVEETGPASGRVLKPEEQALKQAGASVGPTNPDDPPQPKYGTPRKAGKKDMPRICHPLERAGEGQKRFKIVSRNQSGQSVRYILATDRAEAVAYYVDYQKLDPKPDAASADLEKKFALAVTELPD